MTFARLGSHFSSLLYWGLLSKLSATRDYTWRWTWKLFFGVPLTLASEFFGVCIHRTSSVYTHTHTQREPSHTWFSIYFGFPRLGSFFFRRKESRTGFFLFAGVTQVQHDPHRRWQTPDRTTRTPPKSPLYRRKTCDVTHRTGQPASGQRPAPLSLEISSQMMNHRNGVCNFFPIILKSFNFNRHQISPKPESEFGVNKL